MFLGVLGLGVFLAEHMRAQQGPNSDSSTTVAKPRKPATDRNAPARTPISPRSLPIQQAQGRQSARGVPTFRTDAITVTVDTAVLDNKGHFIPNIPKQNFRVLEDGVPSRSPASHWAKRP